MIGEERVERMRARFADRIDGNRDRIAARAERCYAAEKAGAEKSAALTQRWHNRVAAIRRRAEDRRDAFPPPSSRRPREFDFEPDWDDDPGPRRHR
ncbi:MULTISPECIES: hypothetical protein [Amycolatopsis]|uniref:hypothetical protein n=1 Tax=Amycolatopsis TaxID=1813 RepID=UPI001C59CB17|nr:hypothetical protein [Amycolatopsis sp. TNS106]QXV56555.1 hypothetical protein CVV72_05660 [Amycolatopsis sp. TNS106]